MKFKRRFQKQKPMATPAESYDVLHYDAWRNRQRLEKYYQRLKKHQSHK